MKRLAAMFYAYEGAVHVLNIPSLAGSDWSALPLQH